MSADDARDEFKAREDAPPEARQTALEKLKELSESLGNPGIDKLFRAAKRAKINVTKDQVRKFLGTKGEKQIFKPLPLIKGRTAAEAPGARM